MRCPRITAKTTLGSTGRPALTGPTTLCAAGLLGKGSQRHVGRVVYDESDLRSARQRRHLHHGLLERSADPTGGGNQENGTQETGRPCRAG